MSAADPTGQSDSTQALTDWFAALPDGQPAVLPAGTYLANGTPTINGKRGITLNAAGARIVATTDGREAKDPRTRLHLSVANCTAIRIVGLGIKGANPDGGVADDAYVAELEAQHGVDIETSDGVELDGLTITDVYGDFVYVRSDHVWVHGCNFARNGRQGVSFTRGRDLRVEGCTIDAVRRTVFDLEPNTVTETAERAVISENCIGTHRLNFVSAGGSGSVNLVDIRGNMLSSPMTIAVLRPTGATRNGWKVRDNHSTKLNGGPNLMLFAGVDGLSIVNNVEPCGPRVLDATATPNCTNVVDQNNDWKPA